ncbi:ATP-dependent RNA helicase dbp7 [Mycoemilia scoparia]|uniref:ATP-dependent RNA helicase n=1 Tax=Mycoemilia scoparia TaxID=417184 RepID=A0A9W7ZQQ4_9FUNG|nr:ATP-dependent RNA helicase dbp7 [Mycoemilia scoparia]
MADNDDGLVLNFAPQSQMGMAAKQPDSDINGGDGAKRTTKTTTTVKNGGTPSSSSSSQPTGGGSKHQKHVISSLFTRNPEFLESTQEYIKTKDKSDSLGVSSNAVIDGSSFGGLQLDPDLVAHLANKLEIVKPTSIQTQAIPYMIGCTSVAGNSGGSSSGGGDRDVFIQAETGSGKTLTYLLPILHRLMKASMVPSDSDRETWPSRDVGSLAIILTPIRELAQQTYDTIQKLMHIPQPKQEDQEDGEGKIGSSNEGEKNMVVRKHWVVPGLVIGGDKKQSEKARLRKGITILACTPGRLLDHLQSTQSFVVDNLRWLVLDEADRLMELGFEKTLKSILQILDQKAAAAAAAAGKNKSMKMTPRMRECLPKKRQIVLCSATLPDNVKKLADESLNNPVLFKAVVTTETPGLESQIEGGGAGDSSAVTKYSTPSQLEQTCIVTPAKLRLVTLVTLIKNVFTKTPDAKILVFLSNCDAVDYYYHLIGMAQSLENEAPQDDDDDDESDVDENPVTKLVNQLTKKKNPTKGSFDKSKRSSIATTSTKTKTKNDEEEEEDPVCLPSKILESESAKVYRLHGSLPQKRRTEVFRQFSKTNEPSILFTTDVSARGLDLPNVTCIVQFDPPTEVSDYVHRVGRTARLGRVGAAYMLLLPSETEYIRLLKDKGVEPTGVVSMEHVLDPSHNNDSSSLSAKKKKKVLSNRQKKKNAWLGNVDENENEDDEDQVWQNKAAELQTIFERYVIQNKETSTLAKKAFMSSIRAYATHISSERHIFHIKKVHLGHLAKAFALREAPSQLVATNKKYVQKQKAMNKKTTDSKGGGGGGNGKNVTKKQGGKKRVMRASDISEFAVGNVADWSNAPRSKKHKKN